MGEFYGVVLHGPQEADQEYKIIINAQGEEEKIPPERYWEYDPDAMHYVSAPPEGDK